jgi:hypothetical protein
MNTYTDPRVFDMAGAVEKLPALGGHVQEATQATGTTGQFAPITTAGCSGSVSVASAGIGVSTAIIGGKVHQGISPISRAIGEHWQQKTPSGMDGVLKRAKGVEPSTFTLAT